MLLFCHRSEVGIKRPLHANGLELVVEGTGLRLIVEQSLTCGFRETLHCVKIRAIASCDLLRENINIVPFLTYGIDMMTPAAFLLAPTLRQHRR